MQPAGFSEQAVREQLERVLASGGFARSERLGRFLHFVVERSLEGREGELKESLIGYEVFGRKLDYDPKEDAVVRTEAKRLRDRLDKYYGSEGGADPLIIELPKGGYIPLFRRPEDAPIPKAPPRQVWFPATLAAFVVVLAIAAWWWLIPATSEPIVIAVLPLENLSHDPGSDYFADGITDEIIRNLSVIEGLAVRSRTSSFAFKTKDRDLREVGRLLNVNYVLEGSILRSGQQLRINAQLIRVRDDLLLWSGRFDRELTDIFALQDEISRGIVNQLRLKLGGRRRYETSVEAYDLYLRAAHSLYTSTGPEFGEKIGRFEQVIAKDAAFAPAYAGLATAYLQRSVAFPAEHPPDELSKMRSAAEKAIQLDPLSAEAYDALGLVFAREGGWQEAEQSFRRSLQLDPNRSITYTNFAIWYLAVLGRMDEALNQLQFAEKADPLSDEVHQGLALVHLMKRQYEDATRYVQKLPDDFNFKRILLARVYLGQKRFKDAIELLRDVAPTSGGGYLGYAYAQTGRTEEAEKLAATLTVSPFQQALIFAGLGDKNRTLEALDRMTSLGALRVGRTLNFPELATIQGDPRLIALRRKVGLPE